MEIKWWKWSGGRSQRGRIKRGIKGRRSAVATLSAHPATSHPPYYSPPPPSSPPPPMKNPPPAVPVFTFTIDEEDPAAVDVRPASAGVPMIQIQEEDEGDDSSNGNTQGGGNNSGGPNTAASNSPSNNNNTSNNNNNSNNNLFGGSFGVPVISIGLDDTVFVQGQQSTNGMSTTMMISSDAEKNGIQQVPSVGGSGNGQGSFVGGGKGSSMSMANGGASIMSMIKMPSNFGSQAHLFNQGGPGGGPKVVSLSGRRWVCFGHSCCSIP